MMKQLSSRELAMVSLAVVVVVITVIYLGLIAPYSESMERLDSKIASRSQQLEQVKNLQRDYRQIQGQIKSLQRRQQSAADFALFAYVEGEVSRIAGRENLTSMRPMPAVSHNDITEEAVEIKLENVSLGQMMQLLQSFDNAPVPLQVKAMQLKVRFDNIQQLDSSLRISAYTKG
jgi:general secretion pathway protein M